MKTKSASIILVLLLTLGVITVVSFSLGCTEQEEAPAEPSNNTSVPVEATTESSVNASVEPIENTSAEPMESNQSTVTVHSGSSGSSRSRENITEGLEPIYVDNITNIEWQWTSFLDADSPDSPVTVSNPENYTLTFSADGTFYFKADCSDGTGTYTLEGNSLILDFVPPIADCGLDSMNGEYTSLLSTIVAATIEDGKLILFSGFDGDKVFLINGGETEQ